MSIQKDARSAQRYSNVAVEPKIMSYGLGLLHPRVLSTGCLGRHTCQLSVNGLLSTTMHSAVPYIDLLTMACRQQCHG